MYYYHNKTQVQASKVKLVAEYKYEEASGTYTYYEPDEAHQNNARTYSTAFGNYRLYRRTTNSSMTIGPEIELTIDLAGKVFEDRPSKQRWYRRWYPK